MRKHTRGRSGSWLFATTLFFVVGRSVCAAADVPLTKKFNCPGDACTISTPSDWRLRDDSKNELAIEAGDETYTTIWTEPKEDFVKMDLDTLAKKRVDEMSKKLAGPTVGPGKQVVVGKQKGLQFEVGGGIDNYNISYLYTILEGEKNYFRVLQWTLKSKYPAKRPLYEQVLQSFEGR
ncbi:MAG: hypothetical protein U0136_21260 [Bdellovibrionota bacterium]